MGLVGDAAAATLEICDRNGDEERERETEYILGGWKGAAVNGCCCLAALVGRCCSVALREQPAGLSFNCFSKPPIQNELSHMRGACSLCFLPDSPSFAPDAAAVYCAAVALVISVRALLARFRSQKLRSKNGKKHSGHVDGSTPLLPRPRASPARF